MEQMRGALAQAERQVGPLNGVIHAAGILGEKLMIPAQEACPKECEPQFHAKAHGLIVLDELLRGKELDFRIAISSMSSVLGGLGYSTYAAANLFMDAFAQHAAQRGREPWVSVNFGRWELAEGEKERSAFAATADREAMRSDDGLEAFHRILRIEPLPQIVVSNRELESRVAQWKTPRLHGANDTSPVRSRSAAATPPLYSRPNLPNDFVAPRTEDERLIARMWEDLLGIRDVGIHDSFLDLGGDSLLATRALARLRETFLIELSLRTIFDAKTIAELAAIVRQAQQKKNKELELVIGELEILSDESDG
jgi:acyl carrier protein